MPVLFSVLLLLLMIGALVDIITRPDGQIRFLPKLVWILIVIVIPLVGSILWFAIGREYPRSAPRPRASATFARDAPQSFSAPASPSGKSTEQQLAELEREIEYFKQQARLKKLETELGELRSREELPD